MLGNIHEAEDVVQEAFLKTFDKIDSYNRLISFSAWVYKITYNCCMNIIRIVSLYISTLGFCTYILELFKVGVDLSCTLADRTSKGGGFL